MNDAQPSGANGGLKAGSLSPDELDKIAALFVPTWDQPADAGALGATTAMGIPPPPDDVMTGAAQPAPSAKNDPKKTQMGIAAPMQPPPEAAFVPPKRAGVDPMAPTGPLDVVLAAPAQINKPRPVVAPSLADQSSEVAALPRKRSPLIYVIGGGVVVAALAIFFATRGGEKPPPPKETEAPTVESKKLDLPDPNSVSTSAAATTTTAAATGTDTAATTATAADTATAAPTATETAAKTAEPEPPKPTATAKPTATTPPPPPKMTATAAPKPPPATATAKPPPTKKPPQKIKDEF